jgi:hypothetical protein
MEDILAREHTFASVGDSETMNRLCKAIAVSFLLPLLVSTAIAQQSVPTSEKELKLQRQRLQAISMIRQTAGEAPLWDNKKAAVQVLADAADLLWDENPGQGTAWLTRAWNLIEQVSLSPQDEKYKEFFTRSDQSDLRTAVLRVARKHDPQLAEKFLKQLSQKDPNEKERKDRGAFDDRTARSEQLLRLAQQAVETDPELAFSLAEASLADGVSYGLQNVLTSLRKKSTDLANRLFDLAVAHFSSGQPDASEAEPLAGYLFLSGVSFSSNSAGVTILAMNPSLRSLPAVAPSEPQRARIFLVQVYQGILSRPISIETPEDKLKAQKILGLGSRLAPRYNTYAPDLAPAVQGFLAQLRSQLLPDGETTATPRPTPGEDSTKRLTVEELYDKQISELENSADKERNALFRKTAYVKAALATKPEDYLRGKRIAEKIDDDDLRADAISFLLYRAALSFLEKGDLEKTSELAGVIKDVCRRAVVKIALAQRLLADPNQNSEPGLLSLKQQRAFDLLNDLDRDLKKEEPSARVAKILLGRAAVLAKLDKAQALAALEQAVQVISKVDKFDLRDGAAPDLSIGASAALRASVASPRIGFDFRSAIEPMITTDFEQLASVVDRLTPKDVAGVGRLEAAKLYLQKNR